MDTRKEEKQRKNQQYEEYQIHCKYNMNYVIDLCGGGEYMRSPVVIYEEKKTKSQIFSTIQGMIVNKKTKCSLTASNEDNPEIMEVIQTHQNYYDEQLWNIEECNMKGWCIIWSVKYPGLCMTIDDGNYSNDTPVILKTFENSPHQHFVLVPSVY